MFLIVPVMLGFGVPFYVRRASARGIGPAAIRGARRASPLVLATALVAGVVLAGTLFSGLETTARTVVALGIAASPLALNWSLDVNYLVGMRRYFAVFLVQIAQPTIFTAAIVLLWSVDRLTVSTALTSSVLSTVVTTVVAAMLTRISVRGRFIRLRTVWRRSRGFYGSALAEVASARLDIVIALPLVGAERAGYYSVGVTVGSLSFVFAHALATSFFASLARATAQTLAATQALAIRQTISAAVMASVPLAATAYWLIPLVFGTEFESAVAPALVLVAASLFVLPAYVGSNALGAADRGATMTRIQILSLIVGVTAAIAMGPGLGAIGLALASVISAAVQFSVTVWALNVAPRDLVPRPRDFPAVIRRLTRAEPTD